MKMKWNYAFFMNHNFFPILIQRRMKNAINSGVDAMMIPLSMSLWLKNYTNMHTYMHFECPGFLSTFA